MWMFLRWGKDSGVRCSLLVCEDIVDVLDDVNLSAVGEIGTEHPVRGPYSTDRARHMCNIGDEEAMSVGLVALHAYG